MTYDLKQYPAYKDSGVPWLGRVPEHWKVQKLRRILRHVAVRNRPDLPLLSVAREKGVILRDVLNQDENRNFIPDDLSNYKVVRSGQFAMNKMKAWQGSYGVSRYDGIVSPAYFVFDIFGVEREYFHTAVRSRAYVAFFTQASDGVRIGQWDLSQARMREIPFFVPTLPEQSAIVRFLDHADGRIRRYIHSKRRLIELLEEHKQVIIHRAVTRGHDPKVRLKPSGVEWLGDVPEQWEVRAFTRCAVERADYRGATPTKTETGVFLVTAKNIRRGWIDYEASKEFVSPQDYSTIMRRGLPRCNDLLLTTEAPLGNAALVDREDIALAQRVIRFRLDHRRLVPQFALHSVLSSYFQHQLLCRGTGSTALGIKASKLPQLQILCPPIAEQERILERIADECAPLERMAARTSDEIRLIREHRVRLVADVVTGKLDLREAVAQLPEEEVAVEESEALGVDDVAEVEQEEESAEQAGV